MTDDLACVELVELLTEYLEGALSPQESARVERHLSRCDGCTAHLAQMRAALHVAGELSPERLSDAAQERLAEQFRAWATRRRHP